MKNTRASGTVLLTAAFLFAGGFLLRAQTPSNAPWLQIPSGGLSVSNRLTIIVHNTTNGVAYTLLTKEEPTAPYWVEERFVYGGAGNATITRLLKNGRRNLFVSGRTGIPLISRTPLMGFNNWYRTGGAITESYISNCVTTMINNGMRDAGYRYIVLDGGVFTNRDSNGNLVENGAFPSGLTNFVRWLHTNGFKAGIWQENTPWETRLDHFATASSITNHNQYVAQDIQSFANWEFDYIKFDTDPADKKQEDLTTISKLIANTGRLMFLHGAATNYQPWMNQVMNSWRPIPLGDVSGPVGLSYLYSYFDYAFTQPDVAGPGHFWSFDIVSGLGLTTGFEVHMTGAAMWSAEMITANVDINPAFWPYYTNRLFLQINQDAALAPPAKVSSNQLAEIWVKPLETRSQTATNKAVALFNRNSYPTNFTVYITNIFPSGSTIVRLDDVWNRTNSFKTNSFIYTVPAMNAALFRVTRI
jgi:alpha-galactosidase